MLAETITACWHFDARVGVFSPHFAQLAAQLAAQLTARLAALLAALVALLVVRRDVLGMQNRTNGRGAAERSHVCPLW